jgi:hypothetical protein
VVNQGQTTHNLSLDGGPKTPDLKSGEKATLEVGMTFEIRVGGAAAATADHADHADAAQDDSAKLDPNATPRPPGNPTTPSSRRRPAAASTS